jgi:hypothetical protein
MGAARQIQRLGLAALAAQGENLPRAHAPRPIRSVISRRRSSHSPPVAPGPPTS